MIFPVQGLPPGTVPGDHQGVTDTLPPGELRALWDFDDPVGSEAVLRAAADGSSTAPGRQAELLTQVARSLGLQERFDEAHRMLDMLELSTPAVAVRVLLERGRLYRTAGDLPAAVSSFEAAATAAQHAGLPVLEADALHMLALADEDRAPVWTSQALGLVHGSSDPEVQRWAVALENNHAWFLMERGRALDALTHFRAAHDAAVAVGSADQERIARWAVARCLRELGRVTESLEIQRGLVAEGHETPYVTEEIAILEDLIGRAD